VFLLPAAAPVTAWGYRNMVVHGEPVLGSTAAGVNLWIGNHPSATGGYVTPPRPDAYYDRLERYPATSITRVGRAYRDLAVEFIWQHPSRFAVLALAKLERFWWTITPERLGAFTEARTQALLGSLVDGQAQLAFSKLLHAAMLVTLGAGLLWPRHPGPSVRKQASSARWLVIASVLGFWVVHAAFIAEPRYRLPVTPLLHTIQGAGVVVLLTALTRRRGGGRRAAPATARGAPGGRAAPGPPDREDEHGPAGG
jgi:hypothetical protein